MDIGSDEIASLVEGNRVHRRLYTDPALFDLELERIFARAWLYVAHESQLKAHGDFVRAKMGTLDVIVVRHSDGTIRVLHNRCAHRGTRLCAVERGHARSFVCPYHAWSFGTDGRLEALPHPRSYPPEFRLDDPQNALIAAPRVELYRGFVFASLAPSGPSLRQHLGPMSDSIDNLVDRAPDGRVEISDASFRLEFRANWKMHHENASDIFHPGVVHESSVAAGRLGPPAGAPFDVALTYEQLRSNDRTPRDWETAEIVSAPAGHSYRSGFYRGSTLAPRAEDPVRARYRAALAERHGAARASEILGLDRFNTIIFPNLNLNAQYHQLRVIHPIAVDRSLVTAYCFRLAGAPDEIFHRAVRFMNNLSSPASMIFGDDAAVFTRCQAGLTEGGGEWVDFSRGWGGDRPGANDTLIGSASELPMRALHAAWLRHMTEATSR